MQCQAVTVGSTATSAVALFVAQLLHLPCAIWADFNQPGVGSEEATSIVSKHLGTHLYSTSYMCAVWLAWRRGFWKALKKIYRSLFLAKTQYLEISPWKNVSVKQLPPSFRGYLWPKGQFDQLLSQLDGLQRTVHGCCLFSRIWCRGSALMMGWSSLGKTDEGSRQMRYDGLNPYSVTSPFSC